MCLKIIFVLCSDKIYIKCTAFEKLRIIIRPILSRYKKSRSLVLQFILYERFIIWLKKVIQQIN